MDPIVVPDRLNMASWFLDARVAEGRGDHEAVRCGDRRLTYREVQADSGRVAAVLRGLGVRIEERVLLLLHDTPEFVATYFAVLRVGAVAVPANTWMTPDDYAYYLEYARPRAVVVDAEVWPRLAPALASAPYPPHVIVLDRSGAAAPDGTTDYRVAVDAAAPDLRVEPTYRDDFATWLSSSGSTGKPKCVVHMHHDFVWNTVAYAQRTLGITADDVTLSAPKLFFGYALASNLLFPFAVGGTCVLDPDRLEPAAYLDALEAHRATMFIAVPTILAKLVRLAAAGKPGGGRWDLSHLRAVVSAGEALPAELHRRWRDVTGVEIYDGIGSAEMFHIYVTNRPGDVRLGSLGRIVEGYRYRLLDDAGREVAPGEIGTLEIEGPSAGAGYWRMRDRSRETFRGDAVRGSDKFLVDDEGYFWFCGRGDDMLKCSGVYVAPVEVENCLSAHPAVREAGVVGYRDADGLEKALAFVELAQDRIGSPALEAELIAHARATIAAFKAPRRIVFVDALPRTETGKIVRAKLRELAQALPPPPA